MPGGEGAIPSAGATTQGAGSPSECASIFQLLCDTGARSSNPCYLECVVLPAQHRFDFREYLALEAMSPNVKHEFLDGHVFAMAGGTLEHSGIATSLVTLLSNQLRERPCRVFNSDLRVRVLATGLATYPDASVACGEARMDDSDPEGTTLVNPCFLVEVLSPSTESYDRGDKLLHYKQIPSLEAVLLVAHDEPRLELWRRVGDKWTLELARGSESLAVPSLGVVLDVAEVYRNALG
ncbi:MAG: hypothetical protein RL685_2949 [Pseudomonadota bacterium]